MSNHRCPSWLAGFVPMALLAAVCASAQTIAPSSGKALCSALTGDDFTKAGVPVRQLGEASLDDASSAYCIYQSDIGKVELDIYDPAGETPAEAQKALRAAQHAIGGNFQPMPVPGADEASSNSSSPSGANSSIVVRRGATVFNLSLPRNAAAAQQLRQLSALVLRRLQP